MSAERPHRPGLGAAYRRPLSLVELREHAGSYSNARSARVVGLSLMQSAFRFFSTTKCRPLRFVFLHLLLQLLLPHHTRR